MERQIRALQTTLKPLKTKRAAMSREIEQSKALSRNTSVAGGLAAPDNSVDYGTAAFPWTQGMKDRMKKVFGIDNFRLCQEAYVHLLISARCIGSNIPQSL